MHSRGLLLQNIPAQRHISRTTGGLAPTGSNPDAFTATHAQLIHFDLKPAGLPAPPHPSTTLRAQWAHRPRTPPVGRDESSRYVGQASNAPSIPMGTTVALERFSINPTPGWNSAIEPSKLRLPSGNSITVRPAASSASVIRNTLLSRAPPTQRKCSQ